MNYQINVLFESPSRPVPITFSDIIDAEDWTCANYWDDIGDVVSALIGFSDAKLSKLFPHGHDYYLSTVNVTFIGDVDE